MRSYFLVKLLSLGPDWIGIVSGIKGSIIRRTVKKKGDRQILNVKLFFKRIYTNDVKETSN